MARPWTASEDALLGTMTDLDVAREIGASQSSVARRRLLLGVQGFRGKGWLLRRPAKHLTGAVYAKERRAGMKIAQIARKHRVSPTTVTRALERHDFREREGMKGMKRVFTIWPADKDGKPATGAAAWRQERRWLVLELTGGGRSPAAGPLSRSAALSRELELRGGGTNA